MGLFTWTFLESYLVSSVAFRYSQDKILYAIGATGGIVLVVALIARFAPYDFTKLYGYVVAILLVWIIVAFVASFGVFKIPVAVWSGVGMTIFIVFLAMDLQMIMGGGRSMEYSEEDYVLAAISIYLDVLNIFLYVLECFGGG